MSRQEQDSPMTAAEVAKLKNIKAQTTEKSSALGNA